jgi:phosphopantothenoylcysteine decarboxylase/phosphopantothenate--cysteine ligase
MKCIVTAGPTFEELDRVRRLTNFSTGTLGSALADYLAQHGHEVELLTGYYAICPPATGPQRRQTFTTTADLQSRLESLASPQVGAVFHAAAVSDFTFGKIWERAGDGGLREVKAAKIPTRDLALLAELLPTPKIIRHLRGWFPQALLAGWKYELDGDRAQTIAKGCRQIVENKTDICIVNGLAYGEGFGLVDRKGSHLHLAEKTALFATLTAALTR